MAGKQKWGTKQDWLTGQAWCTLVFKGLSRVNPYVVFNPFPGCQGSSLTLQHGSTVGCRKDKGGVCVQWGVPAHLPTSSAPSCSWERATKATESLGLVWVRNVNLCQGRQLQALAK